MQNASPSSTEIVANIHDDDDDDDLNPITKEALAYIHAVNKLEISIYT
jgi:hypothetical protein